MFGISADAVIWAFLVSSLLLVASAAAIDLKG